VSTLYKRDADGRLHYHEAWVADDEIIEHWGIVGTRGETRAHALGDVASAPARVEQLLAPARRTGFAELDEDELRIALVEYTVNGVYDERDLHKRHALEDRMNETLGWTGLGLCDGGSIGSGTMEVCCVVVDVEIAKRVIADDLAGTEFGDFARIYDEGAEGLDDEELG